MRFVVVLTATLLLVTTSSRASFAQFAPDSADKYAAIAFSPVSGRHTDASDRPSRAAAEQAAIAQCRQDGSMCSAPVWVQNGCVALAIGRARGFGSGWGSDRVSAERQALDVCNFKAHGCSIQRTACTGR